MSSYLMQRIQTALIHPVGAATDTATKMMKADGVLTRASQLSGSNLQSCSSNALVLHQGSPPSFAHSLHKVYFSAFVIPQDIPG